MKEAVRIEISRSSRMELFPLRAKQEADQCIVGRPETGSYVAMSDAGYAVVEMLRANRTVAEVRDALARRSGGTDVQLRPFLETLVSAGFVKAVDGRDLPEGRRARRYHLTSWQRRHVAWLFSKPALVIYAGVVAWGVGIMALEPRYLPRPADLFVAPTYATTMILVWLVSAVTVAKHELAHLVAAKLLGLEAGLAISHRMFFPVLQTDLTDLWLADKRQRYLAYAAGMASDVVLAGAVVAVLWLHDRGVLPLPDLAHRAGKLTVLIAGAGVLWQFNFFLRTDVYYMIANLCDCKNLAGDTTAYLKSQLRRLLKGAGPRALVGVTDRELRVIRVYSVFFLVGTASLVLLGAAYLLGVLYVLLTGGKSDFLASRWTGGFRPIDKIAYLMTPAVTCCWLTYSVVAKRRNRPRISPVSVEEL